MLIRKCDILNRGFSGYNSRWWLRLLPRLVPPSSMADAACCVLFLGTNDSSRGLASPTLHVPLLEFGNNMRRIVDYLLTTAALPADKLIIANVPPVEEEMYKRDCEQTGFPFDKFLADCADYNSMLELVAKERQVELLDIYSAMTERQDWRTFFVDGIHFNAAGGKFFFDQLWPLVAKRTEAIATMLPDYTEAAVDFEASLSAWEAAATNRRL